MYRMSSFDEQKKVHTEENRNLKGAQDARRKQGRDREKELFSHVEASEPIGKTSAELKKEMNLSRDRVYTICKKYLDEGLFFKTGKFGKYRLTSKALGDPAKKAFFFNSKMMKDFWSFESISKSNAFCNTEYIQSILNDNKNGRNKPTFKRDPGKDKLSLFEFALRIGSIVTYEMLMAIKFASDCSEANTKDKLAWKWIDNVINPGLILKAFACIPEIERRLKRNSTNERPYSFYDMDSTDVGCLMQSFQSVFPDVYRKSEGILSGLQRRIDSYRKHSKEMSERDNQMRIDDPKHAKCDGKLIPEIKANPDGTKFQQCAKCHRWIKIKKSK